MKSHCNHTTRFSYLGRNGSDIHSELSSLMTDDGVSVGEGIGGKIGKLQRPGAQQDWARKGT
ncbi:hypothetical protein BZG25_01060 [Salinivibrio sp. ML198]|uniref:hypothetical protein n=1 Tax=Salinivibrio sp. ML198 TaxID=1909458 RepID=UPI000989640D|nr:hypothetical protein [Salinivibrio sp. ML198]OOE82470.1 hypothetical protein BZG25_01060 [Salinivibrio sp. ML198]